MAATVSFQIWPAGQTYPIFDIPLATDSGPDNLTGVNIANFTMIFRTLNGVDTIGTGTFSIKANSPAEIYYKPSVADVTTMNGTSPTGAFTGFIIIKALFPPSNSATDEVIYDGIPFNITAV